MRIEKFNRDDIAPFLKLAETENWVAESWEFDFLLAKYSQGCFTARDDDGVAAGFVTSLRHQRSGWIGNLIVSPEKRGQKIGERLFAAALEALHADGTETIWLTASKAGQALYEKYGFSSIDTIIRWVGSGRRQLLAKDASDSVIRYTSSVSGIDCQAWGDRRDSLLEETSGRGHLMLENSGFVVIQPGVEAQQLGPFAALDAGCAELLFDNAVKAVDMGTKVMLDAPASNKSALRMFNRRKMGISGSNSLMYAGRKPDYRSELIYGLATMGSCG